MKLCDLLRRRNSYPFRTHWTYIGERRGKSIYRYRWP